MTKNPIERVAHGGNSFADVPRTITFSQASFMIQAKAVEN